MSIFAVTYHYIDDVETISALRPEHRAWTKAQFDSGRNLASGPLVDVGGALLIFQADSAEQLSEILNEDPFEIAGLIEERVIQEWNPINSPWSN